MLVKLSILAVVGLVALAQGFTLMQFLQLDDSSTKLIQVPEGREDQPNRNCMCKGPACVCCVDFNITFINMGGPGCVHMKYLSPEEGYSVNLSYGKNVLHNSKLKGSNPEPICLQLFDRFAEVCAKFSDLAPTADGLRGCVQIEPRLLGHTQLEFPIGCFKSKAGSMEIEDPPTETEENATEESEGTDFLDFENLLSVAYQTAEKGVAFISNMLELPKRNSTGPIQDETTSPPDSASESQRSGKNLKHPNIL